MIIKLPGHRSDFPAGPPSLDDGLEVSVDLGRRMVAVAIEALLADPYSSFREVASLLALDGELATRALRWANEPLFRRREPVEDLGVAVRVLGFRRLGLLCREMAEAA